MSEYSMGVCVCDSRCVCVCEFSRRGSIHYSEYSMGVCV